MKNLIRRILKEEIKNGKVICDGCGWSWDLSDGGDDKYICHKCGHDNTPKTQSNLGRLMDGFKMNFPEKFQPKIDEITKFVVDYITDNNLKIKFLNSCYTGFSGVRTKDSIIICSPTQMSTLGDFIYTIFHEIRHEDQISQLKMDNPLTDYDLDDFEKLSEQYWKMEMDADNFAKQMVAKLVIKSGIPMEIAKPNFQLSPYIEKYPSMSKMIKTYLEQVVMGIKEIKKSGGEFTDIQDHPIVKRYIDKLEDFI